MSDRPADGLRLTHVGVCVADLERSVAFYRDALGFEEVTRAAFDTEQTARILGMSDVSVHLVYLVRDGVRIELLGFGAAEVCGDGTARPMNLLGLTHLCFRVDDLDATCGRIAQHGGAVLDATGVVFDAGNRGVMATDPDGTRVELIERIAP